LAKVGTKGMFTKEIEEALAEGRIDLAVHSLKDLPTEISSGFKIAAITKREDPRDVFCSQKYQSLDDLPHGARVGTSSLRRQAQLKALRNDLELHPLRGNVDTRLRKLADGCQVPIGALAEVRGDRLHLDAIVASPDGGKLLRESREGDDPMSLGEETGESLLQRGGAQILEEVYGRTVAQPQQP